MPFVSPDVVRALGYVSLFLLVTPLFPFVYVVVRWRSAGGHEPGLGTYSALLYFRSAGILLALAGAANLTYGWISTTEVDEAMTRLSWGMLVGSGVFLAINVGLLFLYGPHPELATARRVFNGFLMVMAGLVAFTALVTFFITLFKQTETDQAAELRVDELKIYGSWTFYFLSTYLASAYLLWRGSKVPGANPSLS